MPPVDNNGQTSQLETLSSRGVAAAVKLEKSYDSFKGGNDGGSGRAAADAASDSLRAEFLQSGKSPDKDAANLTQLDYEVNKLQVDDGSHKSTVLLATAIDWGSNYLGQNGFRITEPQLHDLADSTPKDPSTDTADAKYARLMATTLDAHWRELAGFAHRDLDSTGPSYLTVGDLDKNLEVLERIRTYHPAPPPKSSMERFLDWLKNML